MASLKRTFFVLTMLIGCINTTPAFSAEYIFTDLGNFGVQFSQAFNINNSGEVVGYSVKLGNYQNAFLYNTLGLQNLGSLSGPNGLSYGNSINNSSQVVGESSSLPDGNLHAFLYSNGSMQDLGTLGGASSGAYDINNNGQVVGYSGTNVGAHAFLYSNGSMQDLGTLGGFTSRATGINDNGQIAGFSSITNSTTEHAFLYSNGVMQDLVTTNFGSSFSRATNINNAGQVIGYASVTSGGDNHAFIFNNGNMEDLGTLSPAGRNSRAWGINSSGQVVGESDTSSDNSIRSFNSHAFLYANGKMTDLNSFLDESTLNAGLVLVNASAINDNGWIVGTAVNRNTGQNLAFLLSISAVPETETSMMFSLGLAMMGWLNRKKNLKVSC